MTKSFDWNCIGLTDIDFFCFDKINDSFQLSELYLQNFLMVFPLVADHPLWERVEIVEGNLEKEIERMISSDIPSHFWTKD